MGNQLMPQHELALQMRVQITKQQGSLEKYKTRVPDRWCSSQVRQYHLAKHGLNPQNERRTYEQSQGEESIHE